MALRKVEESSLTAVADAIRTAADSNAPLTFPADFVSAIEGLSGASGGGTPFVCGAQNVESTSSLTIDDLPFTPTDAAVFLIRRSTTKGALVSAVSNPRYTAAAAYGTYTNNSSGYISNITSSIITLGTNSVTLQTTSAYSIVGVYFYVIWRSEEAGT